MIKESDLKDDDAERRVQGRSSHWENHYQHPSWKSGQFGMQSGIGSFIPRTGRRVLIHQAFQVPLLLGYGRHYKSFFSIWRTGRLVAKAQDRAFDFNDLRQVLSLSCVQSQLNLQPTTRHTIAVIGDGFGRLANLLLGTLPKSLVVLCNLPPSLEVDLTSLKMCQPGLRILHPQNAEDLKTVDDDVNVVAIPSGSAHLLRELPIEGAFNISSMQEMDYSVIKGYFDLLRTNTNPSTWFYCANAVEKTWGDGTVVRFRDYPWLPEDRVLFDEICPWAHWGYEIFPPRYVKQPFRIQHRLALLNKRGF